MLKRTDFDYLLKGPLRTFMADVGSALHQAARSITPRVTGRMSQSYKVIFGAGDPPSSVQLTNTQKYFRFVSLGTRPHLILPNRKKALFWPGGPGPRRSVMHPGNAPNPILARAQAAALPEITGPISKDFDAKVESLWNKS